MVGETEHASIQLHIYTNTLNRSTVNLKTGSYVHILSLFTLGTFSWGSTVIIWWYSAVIVRLAPAVRCEAPLLRMQTHGRWYLPGWWCLTSVMHKFFLILLLRWGRCFYQKRQAKKKKKTMRAADALSHPDILFSASILFVKRQALYLCSYPENKQAWRHSKISSREYHSRLPVIPKCSVCGLF